MDGYVSTGHLPSARQVQASVDEAYRLYRAQAGGETSQVYPALARVPGHLFGICVTGVRGGMYRAGDSGHEFTIMSVAKPFVFALVCEVLGAEPAGGTPSVQNARPEPVRIQGAAPPRQTCPAAAWPHRRSRHAGNPVNSGVFA